MLVGDPVFSGNGLELLNKVDLVKLIYKTSGIPLGPIITHSVSNCCFLTTEKILNSL